MLGVSGRQLSRIRLRGAPRRERPRGELRYSMSAMACPLSGRRYRGTGKFLAIDVCMRFRAALHDLLLSDELHGALDLIRPEVSLDAPL